MNERGRFQKGDLIQHPNVRFFGVVLDCKRENGYWQYRMAWINYPLAGRIEVEAQWDEQASFNEKWTVAQ